MKLITFVTLALIALGSPASAQQKSLKERLHGTWHFVIAEVTAKRILGKGPSTSRREKAWGAFLRGQLAGARRDYATAMDHYSAAVELDPGEFAAHPAVPDRLRCETDLLGDLLEVQAHPPVFLGKEHVTPEGGHGCFPFRISWAALT